ncbi:flippase-like domain-containing protein, partial [Candidatus Woesearchaeota archaeon]|nr:flippase-like domain-containing protein [Candidatus Woesearchaeota archaeon]
MKSKKFYFFLKVLVSTFVFYNLYQFCRLYYINDFYSNISPSLIFISLLLMTIGQIIRAEKMIMLINPLHYKCRFTIYKSLFIGNMCNIILPFKSGDLIRAHIMSKDLSYSHTASIVTILFERLFDFLTLLIILSYFIYVNSENVLYLPKFFDFLFFAFILFLFFILFSIQPKFLLNIFNYLVSIFSNKIKNYLRISLWSGGRYLRVIFRITNWKLYSIYTIFMWFFYILSVCILLIALNISTIDYFDKTIESYINLVSNYHANNLDSYIKFINSEDYFSNFKIKILSWGLIVLFPSLIGLFFIFFKQKKISQSEPINQLEIVKRNSKQSKIYHEFLDDHYSFSSISNAMEYFETKTNCLIKKQLIGGSGAKVLLIESNKSLLVRKLTSSVNLSKFNFQIKWLNTNRNLKFIPKIFSTGIYDKVSYIDIEYINPSITFSEFINKNDVKTSEEIIFSVIKKLNLSIYKKNKLIHSEKKLKKYLQDKVVKKIETLFPLSDEIESLYKYKYLVING